MRSEYVNSWLDQDMNNWTKRTLVPIYWSPPQHGTGCLLLPKKVDEKQDESGMEKAKSIAA